MPSSMQCPQLLHAQDLQRTGFEAFQLKLDNVSTNISATTSDKGDSFYVHTEDKDQGTASSFALLSRKTSQLFFLKGAMSTGGG